MRSSFLGAIVLAVIFVNGWTDAANSITTAVSSGTLTFRKATALAAVCELLGLVIFSLVHPTVAATVYSMADLGDDPAGALIALQAALLTVILWAVLAWRFGIPTSESHALLAGLTGASAAIHGDFSGISAAAWARVLAGLLLSTALGALLGSCAAGLTADLKFSSKTTRRGQIVCAGGMAFFHGAQDGQKFLALFLLLRALASGQTEHVFQVSLPLAFLCALVMSLGVACGGQRIVNMVGRELHGLSLSQSFAADLISILCLFAASLFGLPVSTTHTRVSILFGAGHTTKKSGTGIRPSVRILTIWLATFPCCGFLAWLLTRRML